MDAACASAVPEPASPPRPGLPTGTPASAGHRHLWQLADGTGLHAPLGRLTIEDGTGRLCCHLCGRWFMALGAHVRVHGYSADDYRRAMGLMSSRPLTGADLSRDISDRQAARFAENPDVRETLASGHRLARTRTRAAPPAESPERTESQRAGLARGRATTATRRRQRMSRRLGDLGFASLADYLREAHRRGDSFDTMRTATGLGRDRLRALLAEAGLTPRPAGWNRPESRRSRAATADAAAADRVGTTDLRRWLLDRRAEGWSLTRLGEEVGHSGHWVRARLTAPIEPV